MNKIKYNYVITYLEHKNGEEKLFQIKEYDLIRAVQWFDDFMENKNNTEYEIIKVEKEVL